MQEEKQEVQNSTLVQTATDRSREFVFELEKKMQNGKNLIGAEEFSFSENEKFSFEKFVSRVEVDEKMHNLILFQAVANSDGEFVWTAQETEK